MSETKLTGPLVDLWDATGLDVAFGPDRRAIAWPRRNDPRLSEVPSKFQDVVNSFFFKGGKLADHGLKLKDGVDSRKFHGCLQSLMGSFEPPHEVKTAVCGSLIQHYCEPIVPTA